MSSFGSGRKKATIILVWGREKEIHELSYIRHTEERRFESSGMVVRGHE